ncbi:hypothetical protein FACS189447_03530 [Spirochaetia bacterium]|nr:hypothetical protein FACS189447_03530 [Spirochaetia bacterium]
MDFIAMLGAAKDTGPISIGMAALMYVIVQLLDMAMKKIRDGQNPALKIKNMVKREEIDVVINSLLDGAMGALNCGHRIQVVEYSNGDKSLALVNFRYMTCTYESRAIDKEPMLHVCQKVPISNYGVFLMKLVTQTCIVLDVNEPNQDLPLSSYDLLHKRMATKSIYVGIRSPVSKKAIGHILFDTDDPGDFGKALTMLRSLADQIGTLFTLGEW